MFPSRKRKSYAESYAESYMESYTESYAEQNVKSPMPHRKRVKYSEFHYDKSLHQMLSNTHEIDFTYYDDMCEIDDIIDSFTQEIEIQKLTELSTKIDDIFIIYNYLLV